MPDAGLEKKAWLGPDLPFNLWHGLGVVTRMMEADRGELLAAPVEFKRMLSWQLSTPSNALNTKRKRRRKKSQEAKKLSTSGDSGDEGTDQDEEQVDFALDDDEKTAEYAYIYVNSDGEEEIYYSAPESPLTSEDDTSTLTDQPNVPDTTNLHSLQLQFREHRKKKSRRSKKKARYLARAAKVEFFQPLCDLVEDKLQVEVGQLEMASCAQVLSLAEICIRKIRADTIDVGGESVPFLIHSLLSHDREQRASVATHVRWLERLLAVFEKQCTYDLQQRKKALASGHQPSGEFLGRAFKLQPIWKIDAGIHELPNEGEGLYCPLPPVPDMDHLLEGHDSIVAKILLQFANYFFPLFSTKGGRSLPVETSGSLSRSQLAAIHYVTDFIQSRYKSLSEDWSEFLKVWPGYVYWARGQLQLAANAFVNSLNLLTHANDKACILNELGRMFLTFGDRSSACRYFRQSVLTAQPDEQNCHSLKEPSMQVSSFALEAAVWDCGLLTPSSAREAARAWGLVLKEVSKVTTFPWYLHAAACESRLCFHAGQPVGENPSSPLATASPSLGANRELLTLHWLRECERLFTSLVSDHPVLHYHISLVHALSGAKELSRSAWRSFLNDFYGFHEWPDWVEPNTSLQLFSTPGPAPHPWQPLLDMLTAQRLKCAPVMKVHWRLRLLQPYYPCYVSSIWKSMLADHCTTHPGFRLSPEGYLTGDFNLDMPPMRCLLIDPYTGLLQISRGASLQHYNLNQFQRPVLIPGTHVQRKYDQFALPWPLRLFESDQCVVELLMASTVDIESHIIVGSNYHASLVWYGQDGSQSRLDIRKLIRKQLRQSILELAEKLGMEEKESLLDKIMEHGRSVTVNDLREKFKPKYKVRRGNEHRSERRQRDSWVFDFHLQLSYRVVYAEATLCLCFELTPGCDYNGRMSLQRIYGQALVFINCSSMESFTKPKIYCVGDEYGFQLIYPSPAHCSAYQDYHLRHLNYIMAVRTECVPQQKVIHNQLVFDKNGTVVHSREVTGRLNPGYRQHEIGTKHLHYALCLGNRLFNWNKEEGSTDVEAYSYDLRGKNKQRSQLLTANNVHQVTSIPGLIVVHTNKGVALLHPGTLEPIKIEIEGHTHDESAADDGKKMMYQFNVEESKFSVVKVWDVESCEDSTGASSDDGGQSSKSSVIDTPDPADNDDDTTDGRAVDLTGVDFGSCVAAFTVNNRLLVVKTEHRSAHVHVLLDIALSGKTTELHPMGNSGYIVSTTQFPDHFREEIYWLSESGQLLGVLPSVGKGPHGFFSATLGPKSSNSLYSNAGVILRDDTDEDGDYDDTGGLYVFFNDGMGGIVCLRPTL